MSVDSDVESKDSLIETLVRFVPRIVIDQLRVRTQPDQPVGEAFRCATLFADISGFTALTERFAAQGASGTEELTRVLNDYFGRLVGRIHARGGDVVKFAGDALLAIWRMSDADAHDAWCWQAARCAQEIQESLRGYQIAGEVSSLRLRVGIGAGSAACALVGGVLRRWELAVAGASIQEVSAAAALAQPGEVAVAPGAAALLGGRADLEPLRDGFHKLVFTGPPPARAPLPELDVPPELAEELKGFVPRAIVRRLEAGQTHWLGERRRLTVLFVNLPDLHQINDLGRAQGIMQCLQHALYRFEGSLNKLSVDEKGATVIGAFGLPPLAHEDDAARGVKAALLIRAELHGIGVRASVGVTTGRVYCGAVGGEIRREYTVMGGPINLAARLMMKAEGGVLVDRATHEATQAEIDYGPPRSLEMKGIGVVDAWSPAGTHEGPRATVSAPVAMVGREPERRALAEKLEALAQRGESGVIAIEGEAGIGKSFLIESFLASARALDVVCFFGEADAIEKSTAYHAWKTILRAALELEPASSLEQTRERVAERLAGSDRAALAPLLNAVLPLDLPESELTSQMSGEPRANRTRELCVELLRRAANGRPIVMVLDDLHWLDSASWALALQLVREVQPLLLLLATRPIRPEPIELLTLLAHGSRLALGPLSPAETLTMVAARLGARELPAPIARLIEQRAEGHPFFSEELGYALREAGVIEIANGECRIAPGRDLAAIDLPDNIEGIITTRIDRLSPQEQLTLKVASVIGRVFSVDALEAVHPVARERLEILNNVEILAEADLTPLDSPAPNLAYIFKHVITQEVAYGLMLYAQRRELHRTTAQWYERDREESGALNYPLLAHHWASAGEDPQAIDYLERAAQAALRSHANDEVVRFLSDAIERSTRVPIPPARRALWDIMLGQAKRGLGNYPAAGKHLESALRGLGVSIPDSPLRLVQATLAQLARQIWHRLRRPVRVDPERAERLLQAAHALDQLFMIYFFGGEEIRMLYAGLAALNFAEDIGQPTPVLARAYGTLQTIAASIPLHGQMRYFIERAREAIDAVDQLPATSWVLLTRATAIAGLGSWADAEATLEETAKITERLGDDRTWCEATASLGTTTGARGAFRQSIAYYESVLAHGERRRDLQAQGWGIVGQARSYYALGELDTLDPVLEQCADILGQGGANIDFLTRFDDQLIRALRALAARDDARARTLLEATVHSLSTERVATQWMYMQAYGYFADAASELWSRHPDEASDAKLARFAERRLAGYARIFPCGRPRLTLTRARSARIRGKEADAQRLLARALAEASALAMEYEQTLCARELERKPPF